MHGHQPIARRVYAQNNSRQKMVELELVILAVRIVRPLCSVKD